MHLERVEKRRDGAVGSQSPIGAVPASRTADRHLRNVFTKLGISSRAELIPLPEVRP
jgi:hypothetical protein